MPLVRLFLIPLISALAIATALVLAMTVGAAATAAEPSKWQAGVGMESRLQSEVNPDYEKLENVGLLFGRVNFDRIAAQLELGQQERTSSSGSLAVTTKTQMIGLWGRYKYLNLERANPFVGVGAGTYMDQVDSEFEQSEDSREARRDFVGLGTGVGVPVWKVLDLEGEVRMGLIEQREDPLFSFLVRVGVRL